MLGRAERHKKLYLVLGLSNTSILLNELTVR